MQIGLDLAPWFPLVIDLLAELRNDITPEAADRLMKSAAFERLVESAILVEVG